MHVVDLRSDTLTQPTPAMREAMATAEVGDDVFGEDPTVKRLQTMAAERLGKQAALFVPSGTMANLVCELSHCGRGDEMILGDQSHMYTYEQGGSSAVGGIHPRVVPNQPDGRLNLDDIENAIRADDAHFPRTRLIALENTHNRCCGSPLDAAYLDSVGRLARRHGLHLHVDGARLFNAVVALGESADRLMAAADSVSFCLSKGLGAPVGSMVCGSEAFVLRAHRARKVVGGGMRQAGVLAAAGIVALEQMVDRLAEDHHNARQLAQGLDALAGLTVPLALTRTNLVFIDIDASGPTAAQLARQLEAAGVRVLPTAAKRLRAVVHYHVTAEDIGYVLETFARVLN